MGLISRDDPIEAAKSKREPKDALVLKQALEGLEFGELGSKLSRERDVSGVEAVDDVLRGIRSKGH
jgi:hypothetical protein